MKEKSKPIQSSDDSIPKIHVWSKDSSFTKKDSRQSCWTHERLISVGLVGSLIVLCLALLLPLAFFFLFTTKTSELRKRTSSPRRSFRAIVVQRSYTEVPKYGNHCVGVSPYTIWRNGSNETIVMDIDTSSCAFERTPLYFTNIIANAAHHSLTGYDVIYMATAQSFRIYARSVFGATGTSLYSSSQTYRWNVSWMGYHRF